jgi:hypothetical protein
MTNGEVIRRQDVLDLAKKGVLVSNGNYESVCKAINEIPPANPIESCKDAIDRAEAIKVASGYCHPANVAKELAKLPPVTPQPKIGHCKDCKYFEYDSVAKVDGIPLIVAHEICKRWGDGCKTKEDGYCFLFEPKESEGEE